MKIITIPHSNLRIQAQSVTQVDRKLQHFISDLEMTLAKKKNPKGVGLAAPQVNMKWRIFSTQLPRATQDVQSVLQTYINPRITDHSEGHSYGGDKKEPTLEGCLSIPGFYGPVPRWEWLDLMYDFIDGNELKSASGHFTDFEARVIQHEYDHLEGILFIDHVIAYNLPLYKEDSETEKLEELEPELILALAETAK